MYFNSTLFSALYSNIIINTWICRSNKRSKTRIFYIHRENTKDVHAKGCPIYWKFHVNLRFRAGLQYYRRSKVKYAATFGVGPTLARGIYVYRRFVERAVVAYEGRSPHGRRSIDVQIMHCSSDKEPFLVRNALYHVPSRHDSDAKIKATSCRKNGNGRRQHYKILQRVYGSLYLRCERRRYGLICHVWQ